MINNNILDYLTTLEETYDIEPIEAINVSNNENKYEKYIINLEEVSKYIDRNNVDLGWVINEICNTYKIKNNMIAFSCNPASALLNENMEYYVDILLENNYPVYMISNTKTAEYNDLSSFIEACINDDSLLDEALNSDVVKNTFKAGGALAIDHLFGKYSGLDKYETGTKYYDKNGKKLNDVSGMDPKDYTTQSFTSVKRNNAIDSKFSNSPMTRELATKGVNAARAVGSYYLSNKLVNGAEAFIKDPRGSIEKGKRYLNAIQTKTSQIYNRMKNGNSLSYKIKNMFTKILNYLKTLRDKIIMKIKSLMGR